MIGRSNRLRALFVVLVIAGIAVTVYIMELMRQSELPEGIVSGNGRTEATEVDITTKFGGRLETVLVKEGENVKISQILAQFDTRELDAQLRKAEADVRRIRQEREVARAVIAQRASELSLAEKDMRRSIGLYESDSISLEKLERDETAVESARATLTAARAQLLNAEAAIEAAVANAELIKTQIDDSTLRSPIRGRVLYRLAEPGEVLPAGGKVLTVIDPTDMYMTLFLPTEIAARVGIGTESHVVFDGLAEQVIPARVSFIAARAQFTPKEVETRTEREKLAFRIKVQLDREFLIEHTRLAKAGVPGVAYIRLDPTTDWPEHLRTASQGPRQ